MIYADLAQGRYHFVTHHFVISFLACKIFGRLFRDAQSDYMPRNALTNVRETTNLLRLIVARRDVRFPPLTKRAAFGTRCNRKEIQKVTGENRPTLAWHPTCTGIISELV
jgi:hypothetical protein